MNEIITGESGFSWGWIIFLILILWFFVGGGLGGFNGFGPYGRGANFLAGEVVGSNCGASNCEVERRNLVATADTNYRIIDQANATRQVIEATAQATQAKIDFYAYQDLRDKLSESQRENMMLQNKLYSDAKFGVIESQLARMECKMAKQPEIYATSAVCPNAAVINGLGFNGVPFGYGYNCGCNGNVLS